TLGLGGGGGAHRGGVFVRAAAGGGGVARVRGGIVSVRIDGRGLTLDEVLRVARGREPVEVGPEVGARMRASRAVVEEALASGTAVYGVNTGFCELKNRHIAPGE